MRKLFLILSAMLCLLISAIAQNRTVTGKVTDENGQPLARASVLVKGTRIGTTTNAEGNFTLNVPANATTLVVSSVNMTSREVAISGKPLNVALSISQATSLEGVVITGYGNAQQKKNSTSATTTVSGKTLENRPQTSVDEMLAGKVPGLIAPALSGQPGAAQSIRIRGIGSVSAGSNPLFVIDGNIVTTGDNTRLTTTANTLAGINVNDIEDVTVLKDASATALYGSRGANGVILITTKSGKAGKTKFRADIEAGYTNYAKRPENARFVNADEWLMLYEEGLRNANALLPVAQQQTEAQIQANLTNVGKGSGVNTDWVKLYSRQGQQQQYNLSASGGEGKTTFFISGGYFKQEAAVLASDFKRYSFTTNFKHTASNRITLGINLSGSNSEENAPSNGGAFANPSGAFLYPTQNPYNPDGTLNISRVKATDFPSTFNFLYLAQNDIKNLNATQFRGTATAEYAVLSNLKLSTRYGMDYNSLNEFRFDNPFHGDGRTAGGRGFAGDTRIANWISTTQLIYNFNPDKAKNFKIDALVAYEAQKSKTKILDARADGYPPTAQLPLSINAATVVNGKEQATDFDFNSIISTASINYKNKYILNGSFRDDASSRFSEAHRHGQFWSVGAAWNIDQESFFNANNYFTSLKLRGSYGTTGNANIANYGWRQTFGYGANYNGLPGGTFNTIGNSELTWESNKQLDIGLDASFFKTRLSINADYYKRISSNLLFADPLSLTTGFASITRNIGTMQNTGYEITLNAVPISYRDFKWTLSFNISHNENKITKLPGHKDIIDGTFILREGLDYRTWYARTWVGVDPANGDPLWYADSNHKSTVNIRTNALREPLKGMSASPKYFGGLTNTFSYKGASLTADFIYNYGNFVTDNWAFYTVDQADPLEGKYALTLQRWQKPGDITNVPKLVNNTASGSSSFSSRFLQKGDYIRLRNITLGYFLTGGIVSKAHLSSVNIYVRGTNLWTKTYDPNLTIDPEQGVNSTANLDIGYTKTITFGINLGF